MVDPIIKQDISLLKKYFEDRVLEQEDKASSIFPIRDSLRLQENIVGEMRRAAAKYPSAQNKNIKKNISPNIIAECIPCINRIKNISNLDMSIDNFETMLAFNTRAISNLLNLFKAVASPNPIQQNLCSVYRSLRSNCLPDIRRIIISLNLLKSDLRSFNLKALKDQILGLATGIVIKTIITGGINLDIFSRLITDTVGCIVTNINTEIRKINPILFKQELQNLIGKEKTDKWFEAQIDEETDEEIPIGKAANISDKLSNASETLDKLSSDLYEKVDLFNSKIFNATSSISPEVIEKLLADTINASVENINGKLDRATSEILKFLKLSDGNLKKQIATINQIILVQSLLEVLETIFSNNSYKELCGEERDKRFFQKIKFQGQKVTTRKPNDPGADPNDLEVIINPLEITVTNPIVEDILLNGGIEISQQSQNGGIEISQQSQSVAPFKKTVILEPVVIRTANCLRGS